MQIREMMTDHVEIASPADSIRSAAKRMAECDCGVLPVGEKDRLVGMITDRDIAIRAVAKGLDPDECHVADVMTHDVKYVYDDESTEELARNMMSLQVKRLPVLNRQKRLVGIVSLGDLATTPQAGGQAQAALRGISQANGGGVHAA